MMMFIITQIREFLFKTFVFNFQIDAKNDMSVMALVLNNKNKKVSPTNS